MCISGCDGIECFVYSSHVLMLQGVVGYYVCLLFLCAYATGCGWNHVVSTVPTLCYRVWLDNSRATQPNIVEYVKEYLAHNITVSQQDTWLPLVADIGFEHLYSVTLLTLSNLFLFCRLVL